MTNKENTMALPPLNYTPAELQERIDALPEPLRRTLTTTATGMGLLPKDTTDAARDEGQRDVRAHAQEAPADALVDALARGSHTCQICGREGVRGFVHFPPEAERKGFTACASYKACQRRERAFGGTLGGRTLSADTRLARG